MRVLSLFDGMACGMIAMRELGWGVESYDAYEIDKYAIKVATHNFPMIKEHGDVFNADFAKYDGVDWLIGGSPCTYWTIAQSPDKRETTSYGIGWDLFSQYVRALKEAKPKFFLYENNKSMSSNIRAAITNIFGFEPICINSSLVSAQNRQRLYWVGIKQQDGTYCQANIPQLKDKEIFLKDIINNNNVEIFNKPFGLINSNSSGVVGVVEMKGNETIRRIYGINGKSPTLTTMQGGHRQPKFLIGDKCYKAKVNCCAKLQTIPEWYDFNCISNSQAFKCIGNGWTIEVIKHLLESAMKN